MASPTHYAGLMMRLMVGEKLRTFLPDLQLSAIDMPYWGIHYPLLPALERDRTCMIASEQRFDFTQLRYYAEAGLFSRFEWHGYGQRLGNFPSKEFCRDLFRCDDEIGMTTSPDTIVCSVRGAEILHAIHPGYTVVPVDFYADIIETTRLTPIFMGQTDDNSYTRRLRQRFPKADFIPHMGPIADFQTIRKAHHIVMSVSTFSWLAAWLSHAETIVMPVFGLFDQRMFPDHDLLPLAEPAYRFFQFPQQRAVPLAELEAAHASIKGQWTEVSATALLPHAI